MRIVAILLAVLAGLGACKSKKSKESETARPTEYREILDDVVRDPTRAGKLDAIVAEVLRLSHGYFDDVSAAQRRAFAANANYDAAMWDFEKIRREVAIMRKLRYERMIALAMESRLIATEDEWAGITGRAGDLPEKLLNVLYTMCGNGPARWIDAASDHLKKHVADEERAALARQTLENIGAERAEFARRLAAAREEFLRVHRSFGATADDYRRILGGLDTVWDANEQRRVSLRFKLRGPVTREEWPGLFEGVERDLGKPSKSTRY